MQVHSAELEMSWPAVAIDTFKDVLTSFKIPVTIITPVPITKLPNINGHKTRGIGGVNAGPCANLGCYGCTRSTAHLQGTWIDDVGRRAFDEVDHIVKGGAEIQLVIVFFYVADVGRADAVFQTQ